MIRTQGIWANRPTGDGLGGQTICTHSVRAGHRAPFTRRAKAARASCSPYCVSADIVDFPGQSDRRTWWTVPYVGVSDRISSTVYYSDRPLGSKSRKADPTAAGHDTDPERERNSTSQARCQRGTPPTGPRPHFTIDTEMKGEQIQPGGREQKQFQLKRRIGGIARNLANPDAAYTAWMTVPSLFLACCFSGFHGSRSSR